MLAAISAARAELPSDVRLFAIAYFVENECVGMKVDKDALNTVLNGVGFQTSRLDERRFQDAVQATLVTLSKDVKQSCSIAWKRFGPDGTTVQGIIVEANR